MNSLHSVLSSLLSHNADMAQQNARRQARKLGAEVGACFEVSADGILSVLPPSGCAEDLFAGNHRVKDWSAALERVEAYAAARHRAMPACLRALSPRVRAQLNESLCNDEASSDQELQDHWRQELRLSAEQAGAAIAYRSLCLANVFYRPFSETLDNL